MNKSIVSIAKVENHYSNIKKGIFTCLDSLHFKPDSDRVFIKPNLVEPISPRTAVVTDPRVVAAIIEYIDGFHCDIIIGEAPRIGVAAKRVFEVCGYNKLKNRYNVKLVDLRKVERKRYSWKYGVVSLPKLIEETCYIDVAKLKTHTNTTVTLGLKNQKGLLLDSEKKIFHWNGLHEPIAHLATVVTPKLTVIDGVYGIEGNGPGRQGRRKKVGLVIIGDNVVSTDASCCKVIGFNPLDIPHIKIASELGVGSLDAECVGLPIEQARVNFAPPESPPHFNVFNMYVWSDDTACSACSSIEIKRFLLKKPWLGLKIFRWCVLGRTDFLLGRECYIPKNHGKIICLGNCSKDFAKKHKLTWVKGCPPGPEDIINAL